jgi:hypothetical protein
MEAQRKGYSEMVMKISRTRWPSERTAPNRTFHGHQVVRIQCKTAEQTEQLANRFS